MNKRVVIIVLVFGAIIFYLWRRKKSTTSGVYAGSVQDAANQGVYCPSAKLQISNEVLLPVCHSITVTNNPISKIPVCRPVRTICACMKCKMCCSVQTPLGVIKSVSGAAPGPIAAAVAVAAGGVLTGYEYLKSIATTALTTAIHGTGPAKTSQQYFDNPSLSGGAPFTLAAVKIAQKFDLGLTVSAAEWAEYNKIYDGCAQAIWNYYPASFPGGHPVP